MKRAILGGVLTIGLLSLVLSAPSVARADFFSRILQCPTQEGGVLMTSEGTTVSITDVIVSAGGPLFFQLYFNDPDANPSTPNQNLVQGILRRGGNLVSNFSGNVQGEGLRLVCRPLQSEGNTTTIYATIVGEGSIPSTPE